MLCDEAVEERAANLDLGSALRESKLGVLELGNRAPKRLTFLRVRDRVFQHLLRARLRHDRHAQSFLLKILHQHHEPGPLLAQQVVGGHPAAVKRELRGVLAFHPHLFEPAAPDETGPVCFDDEEGQAAVRVVGVFRASRDHD